MEKDILNQRNFKRIPHRYLPPVLQDFIITFESGLKIKARTIDASYSGISFLLPVSSKKVTDYNINIKTMDNRININTEIVYLMTIDADSSKISIKFSKHDNLNTYFELLESSKADDS